MKNVLSKFFVSTLIVILCFSFSNFLDVKAQEEDSWTTMTPMPAGGAGAKATVVNGKIYVIVSNINYEYDPATNTWATRTPMPTSRSDGIAVAAFQNKIYVIGGRIKGGATTGINEVYDPATDTWETKTPMPTSRQGLQANVANEKIYLIGGLIPNLPDIPMQTRFNPQTSLKSMTQPQIVGQLRHLYLRGCLLTLQQ